MTRHCRPRREERHPRHSPANASSWNPLIRRKPGGPERIATSLSFLVCQVGSAQASELANQRRRLRGRGAWPFTTTGATIVGCDISRKLVAQAIELSRTRGVHASTSFLVADADHLPFRDETFDAVLTYGALHHLPDPARTCRDIQRMTRVGGVHFASENNKSAFRSVFDLLMKVKPLWVEEAGQEPHLVDALGDRLGAALLTVTDAVGASLPLIRRNGGLIVFEVEKLAPYAATP